MEIMEQLLTLWVNDLNQLKIPVTERAITSKAKSLLAMFGKRKEERKRNENNLPRKALFLLDSAPYIYQIFAKLALNSMLKRFTYLLIPLH